ncbi:uroporphyrinogen decarboxylase [Eubacterium limosum]|uniref:uroporphyrinogen decarboxylase family protein n=1 Tax=Eubacterium limosum TaxID=1736 RepID=UPI001D06A62D|nr:uroporphyrinogen decarboxylase family protein [Eubacterium limosum]MCB6570637.1 uroporphyrinogen decarboxylase [Eubacterium limosum]
MEINKNTVERNQLYTDVRSGKIPKRVPINLNMDAAAALEYAGYNLNIHQFDINYLIKAMERVAEDFESDNLGVTTVRFPHFYKLLGARHFQMGSDGFLQHPEISVMEPGEYDALIEAPYKFLWDAIIPRLYKELDKPWPESSMSLAKGFSSFYGTMGKIGAAKNEICLKYGKSNLGGAFAQTDAPMDFIADLLRSFTGMSMDIRRNPEKVEAACEAILPLMIKAGAKGTPEVCGACMIPLHMATYIKEKDFERFYWPTFKKLVEELVKTNTAVSIFMENDFTRYLDYMQELPEGCQLMAEFGDPRLFKEKLGSKFILTGFYPLSLLKAGTLQQVKDKAKEIIDVLAPGGNYIFSLDKSLLLANDADINLYKELLNFVKEYGVY